MSAMIPMAMFGLEVPCGDVAIPAISEIPSAFRITMAAIDPSAEPEETDEPNAVPRATLKVIRQALVDYDSEDDDDDDEDEDEDGFNIKKLEAMLGEDGSDDSDDEDVNGGPSDPARSKKAKKAAAQKAIAELLANDGGDDDMDVDGLTNGKKSAKALGKMPASDDDEDEDDEDSDDDEEGEVEEFVICTLDPAKNYQQPLDITIGENERVFFKVSGTHSIFLTGNYVEPTSHDHAHGGGMYDPDSDEEDDYDLEPDSDEEIDYDSEDDELDDMEDPRITEIEEDEAPELVKASKKTEKKGKNKRAAEDEPEAATGASIDELIAKAEEKPLSKKQLKKLKKNDGSATETKTEEPASAKSDKKVSFAKQLEQGPTPTKADAKKADAKKADDKKPASSGIRVVQGVTIDDKKLGTGPAAKAGDKVGMRYIGKLEKDGKVFDSNKKGKPFTFKLGVGEVIKGWDIGVAGMTAGGERRITIPAHLGYGKQGTGPIPGNANLVFDVKLLSVAKK